MKTTKQEGRNNKMKFYYYKIIKRSGANPNQTAFPILMTIDGTGGPFDRNAVLAGSDGKTTAAELVMRILTGEARPDDPEISCEGGGAELMVEWLGFSEADIERSQMILKIARPKQNAKTKA